VNFPSYAKGDMNFHSETKGCIDRNNLTAIDEMEFKELFCFKQATMNFSGMVRVYMNENCILC
jgi:hypothetical protein